MSQQVETLSSRVAATYKAREVEGFLDAGAFAQNFAGALLVGIKVGLSDLFLNFIELVLLGLDVKETSALPRCVF